MILSPNSACKSRVFTQIDLLSVLFSIPQDDVPDGYSFQMEYPLFHGYSTPNMQTSKIRANNPPINSSNLPSHSTISSFPNIPFLLFFGIQGSRLRDLLYRWWEGNIKRSGWKIPTIRPVPSLPSQFVFLPLS
ncbi:hypothetical protein AVEN_242216-1 [Araneus ventricosus]|uniref:Uncharacterized protein n=1 Tax=Araneus ventricosus TaxID=182803 RepID=A0A4Y2FSS2_ARAVE|nr:hypothetical protein AVEN_242216-1 [Araneus ventricosus]